MNTEHLAPFQWKPGSSGNPAGKPRTPEWLHGHRDELLRLQLQAATTGRLPLAADPVDGGEEETQIVHPKERLMAMDSLLNRLMGRPKVDEDRDEDERSQKVQSLLVALTTSTMVQS